MLTFEDIVRGERAVQRVAEDAGHIAFLSPNPVRTGHVIVIPRRVADSIFDMGESEFGALMEFARKVGLRLRERLPCARVCVAAIGWQVRHAHVHLIPTDAEGQFPPLGGSPATDRELEETALRLIEGGDDRGDRR
jgi:histidine triad (HIT) family protein